MFRIDNASAAVSLPTPAAAGTPGYFTKGDPASSVPATVVTDDWLNAMQEEIMSLLAAAGITPDKTNFTQVLASIRELIQLETGNYAVDTGTANNYTIAPNPVIETLTDGLALRMKVANANTGASTVDVNSNADVPIVRQDGTALKKDDILASSIVTLIYSDALSKFILSQVSPASVAIDIQAQTGNYAVGGGTANAHTVTLTPALSAHKAGLPIRWKSANTNTGAATLNPNGVGAIAIQLDGAALTGGEILSGKVHTAIYDGAAYQLLNPAAMASLTRAEGLQNKTMTTTIIEGVGTAGLQFRRSSAAQTRMTVYIGNGSTGTTDDTYFDINNNTIHFLTGTTKKEAVQVSNACDGVGYSSQLDILKIGSYSGTSRSLSAAGTLNASGADYAEYETKSDDCEAVAKGQIIGFNVDGKITDKWNAAVSFGVKTTNPSYVGGDVWGTVEAIGQKAPMPPEIPILEAEFNGDTKAYTAAIEKHKTSKQYRTDLAVYEKAQADFEAALETARQKVDRIAYSGKVPVNVTGATVGDYIIAVQNGTGIGGKSVTTPTFDQYRMAVGRVRRILSDGRAEIVVVVH